MLEPDDLRRLRKAETPDAGNKVSLAIDLAGRRQRDIAAELQMSQSHLSDICRTPSNANNRCQYLDTGTGAMGTRNANTRYWMAIAGCIVIDGEVSCGEDSNRAAFRRRVLPNPPTQFRTSLDGGSATVSGVIGPIGQDWTVQNPLARVANFSTPWGPVQFHAYTSKGTIFIGDYEVRDGALYELTVSDPPRR